MLSYSLNKLACNSSSGGFKLGITWISVGVFIGFFSSGNPDQLMRIYAPDVERFEDTGGIGLTFKEKTIDDRLFTLLEVHGEPIQMLKFQGCTFNVTSKAPFTALGKSLKAVYLLDSKLTADDVGVITRNSSVLAILILQGDSVNDSVVGAVVQSKLQLEIIGLVSTKVTAAGITKLGSIPSILNLTLTNTVLDKLKVDEAPALPKLSKLNLTGTKLKVDAVKRCLEHGKVRFLNLKDNNVDVAYLRKLGQHLEPVEYLNLSMTKVDDSVFPILEGLTRLRIVFLEGTSTTVDGVLGFAKTRPEIKVFR